MIDDGPTRGAYEQADDSRWESSPRLAFAVRLIVVLTPAAGAFVGLLMVADMLYRPPGLVGLVVWFVQGQAIGTLISMLFDRLARRMLPLATLYNMSLVFPDQAPSRFGVALRAGSSRRLQDQIAEVARDGLGPDAARASIRAIEFVALLSRHDGDARR